MSRGILVFLVLVIIYPLQCPAQPWLKPDRLREQNLLANSFDSALYYADEAMALVRGIKGENCPEYAAALGKTATAHFYLGNYTKAKYFILKETALRESLGLDDDAAYLSALENASLICRKAGDYEEALVQVKKAEKKSARLNGGSSAGYARTLAFYGGVCYDMGAAFNDIVYLKKAEDYYRKAEVINSSLGGKMRFAVMQNKSDQAAYHNDIGNLPMCEILLQEILAFALKEYGSSSIEYAAALNNLGIFYFNSGNFKFAEESLSKAAAIYTTGSEAKTVQTGICISNLGALYHEMGNFVTARKMTEDAKEIFEENHLKGNSLYAIVLNNIASINISQEYYATNADKNKENLLLAGRLLLMSDSIFSLNCPNTHPVGFSIKTNLSICYVFNGETRKAVRLNFDQTLDANVTMKVRAMMNKMPVSGSIPVLPGQDISPAPEPVMIPIQLKMMDQVTAASMANNQASESDALSNKLIELILGKATRLKNAVGQYHPAYANVLKSLIVSYGLLDISDVEEELTLEYMNVINHKTLQDFSFLSENEKELYYQTRLPDIHSFTAYSLRRKKDNPAITCHTYNNILLNKGLMLKSSTAMRVAILGSNDQKLLKMYDDWISLQKEISALYSTPVEIRTSDVAELEKKANELERNLVAGSQDFSDYRKGIQATWEDVRKSLKPDEAAIEFTDFKKFERNGGNAVIYAALVLRSDSRYPEMVKLFEEEQLEEVIGSGSLAVSKVYSGSDNRLYDLVWKPLEQYLSGVKTVYVSPSGLLFRVSFPAISNGKDAYLCDRFNILVEGSTGTASRQSSLAGGNTALIFGGIRYSHETTGQEVWNYLEGTKSEADAIDKILEKGSFSVDYLTEDEATETYFKQNAGKFNLLHLATHGFFFDDPNEIKFEEKKENIEYGEVTFRGGAGGGFGVSSFVNNANPLMRSGLVFAGANDVWIKKEQGEADDGVLTAQEVTQIDMRKSNLVVLSACETGLGDIRGTEGVYGLQRSLKMAGVKNIIMSLWEIPDRETVEFMSKFYDYMLSKKDIRGAYIQAQRDMRMKYDPYYWGAFVLME